MDQGILEAFKRRYKKQLLRHVILENESSMLTVPEIVKNLPSKMLFTGHLRHGKKQLPSVCLEHGIS